MDVDPESKLGFFLRIITYLGGAHYGQPRFHQRREGIVRNPCPDDRRWDHSVCAGLNGRDLWLPQCSMSVIWLARTQPTSKISLMISSDRSTFVADDSIIFLGEAAVLNPIFNTVERTSVYGLDQPHGLTLCYDSILFAINFYIPTRKCTKGATS